MDSAPLLAVLQDAARAVTGGDWPVMAALQSVIDAAEVRTASGWPLRLVPPVPALAEPYELRLYQRGELEFRERNWHDLFNVLVWLTFPRAKAALNARHHAELAKPSATASRVRGPVRDALTLFDESGVIVLSADQELLDMIRGFRWKTLFCAHRGAVIGDMLFVPFGHALCEKALAPYRGMTGRALLMAVGREEIDRAPTERLRHIDGAVAAWIADAQALRSPAALAPLPVLGVPGWCADNRWPAYYDDPDHFRSGRRRGPVERHGGAPETVVKTQAGSGR